MSFKINNQDSVVQNILAGAGDQLEKGGKAHPVGFINKYNEMKMGDGTWKYVGKKGASHPAAQELAKQGHKLANDTASSNKKKEEVVSNNTTSKDDPYSGLTKEQREKVKEVKPTPTEKVDGYDVVITFSDQKLLNLWENEMSGQISDGQWENSRNTEWIWNSAAVLGKETKVEVVPSFGSKKTSFPFNKELKEIVGERATKEAGFKDLKETSAAWKEINDAIKNHSQSEERYKKKARFTKTAQDKHNKLVSNFKGELGKLGFDNQYSFSSTKKVDIGRDKELNFKINPEKLTSRGTISVEVKSYETGIPTINQTIDVNNLPKFIEVSTEYAKVISSLTKSKEIKKAQEILGI